MNPTPPQSEREKLEYRLSEILTRIENAVEQSTAARIHGRMSNNRLIHAGAMTELSDLILAEKAEAIQLFAENLKEVTHGQSVAYGTHVEQDIMAALTPKTTEQPNDGYTGLDDKNGHKIYAGDLFRWGVHQGKVYLDGNVWCFGDSYGLKPCNLTGEVIPKTTKENK